MWSFLNTNAGAIQALAAVVTAVLTFVLVKVTANYVRLTKELAAAAASEATSRRAAEVARLHDLGAMLKTAGLILDSYPTSREGVDRAMRQTTSWESFNFDKFRELSTVLGGKAGHDAATAVSAISYLRDRARAVQASNERHGFNWESFPWKEYLAQLDSARSRLADIRQELVDRLSLPEATA